MYRWQASSAGRRRRSPTRLPAGVAVRTDPGHRRLDADQPPDDLPLGARLRGALPRLPVGLHRRRDRLLEGRRDRGPERRRRLRAATAPEPVHRRPRSPSTSARSPAAPTSLPSAPAMRTRPTRTARRSGRRRRSSAPTSLSRAGDRPGDPRRPHLREALRQRRPRHPGHGALARATLSRPSATRSAAPRRSFDVRVLRAGAAAARPGNYTVRLLRDGAEVAAAPITSDDFTTTLGAAGTGRYSIEVTRSAAPPDRIEVYSSPVWFEVGPAFRPREAQAQQEEAAPRSSRSTTCGCRASSRSRARA